MSNDLFSGLFTQNHINLFNGLFGENIHMNLITQSVDFIYTDNVIINASIDEIGEEETVIRRGFVYDINYYNNPENTSPENSNYNFIKDESGDFNVGSYSLQLTGLNNNTVYYARSFAETGNNEFSYGNELEFQTIQRFEYRLNGGTIHTVNNSPYIISGLSPETIYDLELRSIMNDVESEWSSIYTFTTLEEVISISKLLPFYSVTKRRVYTPRVYQDFRMFTREKIFR